MHLGLGFLAQLARIWGLLVWLRGLKFEPFDKFDVSRFPLFSFFTF